MYELGPSVRRIVSSTLALALALPCQAGGGRCWSNKKATKLTPALRAVCVVHRVCVCVRVCTVVVTRVWAPSPAQSNRNTKKQSQAPLCRLTHRHTHTHMREKARTRVSHFPRACAQPDLHFPNLLHVGRCWQQPVATAGITVTTANAKRCPCRVVMASTSTTC
jgi:hypothetical protein